MPQPPRVMVGFRLDGSETHYTLLGLSEEATVDDLKASFHKLSLVAHPDKGGDADAFHAIEQAYKLLDDPKRREAYDEELRKERERAELVENLPKKAAAKTEVARVKTAATPGSKRQMVKQALEHTKPSCNTVLKALCDDVTQEDKAEAVFKEYEKFGPIFPKIKKREYINNLRGKDKQLLKEVAKKHEAEAKAKAMSWLAKGPTIAKTHEARVKEAKAKAKAKAKAELPQAQPTDAAEVENAGEGVASVEATSA